MYKRHLVKQITVGKKVTELSQQKKTPGEEPDKKSNTIIYNTPEKKPVRPAVTGNKALKKYENVRASDNSTSKAPENRPIRKLPENKVREDKVQEVKNKKTLGEKFADLFPKKEDPALEKIRKVVFMCSIVAIVVCGYMVGDYYIDLGKSKNLHEEIANIYEPYHPPKPVPNISTIYEPDYEREYSLLDGAKKLLDMNPDVVGYITIPDTPVANPVMQYTDNEKYLNQNINGDTSRAGEIFLDYRNNFDKVSDRKLSVENSDNLVIYGHNMGNDTMFGCLKYYQRMSDYYTKHPVIYLNSNYECYTYKIFAYFILDAGDTSETAYDCWNKFDFDDEEDFYRFVNEAKKRTLRTNNIDVEYGDKILTLSTCNPILGDRGRLIVMGRLLRDGEDALDGTDKNEQNTNIKWPSIYYEQKPNERYNPDAEFIPYG
ncbi:MAG: class B sortase [Ruminococcus sp.]|nr:class B sortase [Ruminococcus sp.]